MNLSKFFIDRPIFAGVLSVLIFLAGLIALRVLPISEYPEVVPPSVVVRAQYPGANPKVIAETVATPLEEPINGVEDMLYMGSQATTDGLMTLTVTFKLGTDPDKAQQLVQNRVAQAEPRLPEEVRRLGVTTVKSSPDLTMVVHLVSPNDRYDMTYLRNYARAERQGPAGAHRRRRPGAAVRRRRLFDARLARPAEGRRARPVAERRRARDPRAERAGRRRRRRRLAERCPGSTCSSRSTRRAACRARRSSATSSSRPAPTARSRGCATSRASSSAPPTTRCARCSTTSRRSRIGDLPGAGLERARRSPTACARRWPSSRQNMPEGVDYEIVYDTTQFVRASIEAVVAHAARGDRAGRARRHPVPADLARLDHPAARGAGVDRRHLRGDACSSASRSTR